MATTEENRKQGKKNRASGKRFELKVRDKLESDGWLVFRNSMDVNIKEGCMIQTKGHWNPFTKRVMTVQSGYPDFVMIRVINGIIDAQFVECKINGQLTKEEKEKNEWIRNNLHLPVLVAFKGEKRGIIEYKYV